MGGGVVVLSDGASVPYDWLVVSLGAETSTFGVPGVRECALPFATYQDSQRVSGVARQEGWLAARRSHGTDCCRHACCRGRLVLTSALCFCA